MAAPSCRRLPREAQVPIVNVPEDTHCYSSDMLLGLIAGDLTVEAAWRACWLNRRLRFGDALDEASAAHCNALIGPSLLVHSAWGPLREWWRFALQLRRAAPGLKMEGKGRTSVAPPNVGIARAADGSLAVDDAQPVQVLVDLAVGQLRHIVTREPLAMRSTLAELLSQYESLAFALRQNGAVAAALPEFEPVRWAYQRVVHLPAVSCRDLDHPGVLSIEPPAARVKSGAEPLFEGMLERAFVEDLTECLAQATVFFAPIGATTVAAYLHEGLGAAAPALVTLARRLG